MFLLHGFIISLEELFINILPKGPMVIEEDGI